MIVLRFYNAPFHVKKNKEWHANRANLTSRRKAEDIKGKFKLKSPKITDNAMTEKTNRQTTVYIIQHRKSMTKKDEPNEFAPENNEILLHMCHSSFLVMLGQTR